MPQALRHRRHNTRHTHCTQRLSEKPDLRRDRRALHSHHGWSVRRRRRHDCHDGARRFDLPIRSSLHVDPGRNATLPPQPFRAAATRGVPRAGSASSVYRSFLYASTGKMEPVCVGTRRGSFGSRTHSDPSPHGKVKRRVRALQARPESDTPAGRRRGNARRSSVDFTASISGSSALQVDGSNLAVQPL